MTTRDRVDEVYGVPIVELNPDIKTLGPGPVGTRCGSCANLTATHAGDSTVYYCQITGQAKKVTWPSCAFFREAPLPYLPLTPKPIESA